MINMVILVGRLGRKPELTFSDRGLPIVNFSLATEMRYKEGSIIKTEAEWHRVRGYGSVAEACNAYLDKGRLVYIRGHLLTVYFQQDKIKTSKTFVIIDEIKFLQSRPSEPYMPTEELPEPPVIDYHERNEAPAAS